MKVSKIIENFANSNTGKKIYKWAVNPDKEHFLNNTLPQVETVLSTACYVWSTAKQKNIEKDQRDLLQIQNIGSGIVGIGVASWANRKVGKLGEAVIKDLDPKKVDPKTIKKITSGIRVAIPLAVTSCIMRLAIPSVLAAVSGKMMDKVRSKRQEDKKLDIKA